MMKLRDNAENNQMHYEKCVYIHTDTYAYSTQLLLWQMIHHIPNG
jgi:hypothetical protein